jgi:hypothetical protein
MDESRLELAMGKLGSWIYPYSLVQMRRCATEVDGGSEGRMEMADSDDGPGPGAGAGAWAWAWAWALKDGVSCSFLLFRA